MDTLPRARAFSTACASAHKGASLLLLLLLSLALPGGLTGCTCIGNCQKTGTLLFGTALSLGGANANEGELTLEGYQLWVKEVNAHGGIKVGDTTYQVRLKYYDDGSDAAESAMLTQQLVTVDKVNFLLGPYGSAATLQDETVAEQYQIPMVEGEGAAQAIFSHGYHYIFGVLSPAAQYASVMIEAAMLQPTPPQTVAILYANDAFSVEVANAAQAYAATRNLQVVSFQEYATGDTDLTAELTKIKTAGPHGTVPDMIIGSGHEQEAVTIVQQCKKLGINAKLYGFTVGPATPNFITALGPDANDIMGSAQWTAQETYQGSDFFGTPAHYEQLYKQEYGHEPSYQSAEATASGLAFQYAIQQAGSIDPQQVRDALASLFIMTFNGELHFDDTGENNQKPMAAIQIQKGQLVTVYPIDVANARLIYPTPPFGSR